MQQSLFCRAILGNALLSRLVLGKRSRVCYQNGLYIAQNLAGGIRYS